MAALDVSSRTCPNDVSTLKPQMRNIPTPATGMASLLLRRSGCLSKVTMTAKISAADVNDTARIVSGGISVSINFTAGQLSPHNTPISRNARRSRDLMFACKVKVQYSLHRIWMLLSFYCMGQSTYRFSIWCYNLVATMRLYFSLSLQKAFNLFSVLNEVADVDDAHRVHGP